ncbi:MAG: SPOR domain-containing protein [Fibromonadaceae bacterium]|jgi:hypothetical protein|nr:SPOR domain-containing protein [Fibromonadaceae bacterium]
MNNNKEEHIATAIGTIGTVGGIGSLIVISAVAASTVFFGFDNAKHVITSIIQLWGPGIASMLGGASSFATYFNWFLILQRKKKLSIKEEGESEGQNMLGDFIQSLPDAFKSSGCFQQIVTAALGVSLVASAATYTPLGGIIKAKLAEKAPLEKIIVPEKMEPEKMEPEETKLEETEPEENTTAKISEKEGKFVIQIILMNTMSQAERVVKKLEMNGVGAYIARVKDPAETKGIKYRVRVGDFRFMSEAKAYALANITPLGYRQWYIDNKSNDTIGKPVGYKPPEQLYSLPVVRKLEPPAQVVSAPNTVTLPEDPYAVDMTPESTVSALVNPPAKFGGGFWNTRNKLRMAALGMSIASLGLGIHQNNKAESESKYLKEYREAAPLTRGDLYGEAYQKFHEQKNSIEDTKNIRNGFYIGAGTLGIAGVATFFF